MPVCSFFLRGLCTNKDVRSLLLVFRIYLCCLQCPYSHVNVNHNAAVCSAFLKGYCPEGSSCKLKHTKECQSYNKNGYCPDKLNGKCKLQHNKDSKHGKDSRQGKNKSAKQKNTQDDENSLSVSSSNEPDYFTVVPKFLEESESAEEEELSEYSSSDSQEFSSGTEHHASEHSDDEDSFDECESSQDLPVPIPAFLKL